MVKKTIPELVKEKNEEIKKYGFSEDILKKYGIKFIEFFTSPLLENKNNLKKYTQQMRDMDKGARCAIIQLLNITNEDLKKYHGERDDN